MTKGQYTRRHVFSPLCYKFLSYHVWLLESRDNYFDLTREMTLRWAKGSFISLLLLFGLSLTKSSLLSELCDRNPPTSSLSFEKVDFVSYVLTKENCGEEVSLSDVNSGKPPSIQLPSAVRKRCSVCSTRLMIVFLLSRTELAHQLLITVFYMRFYGHLLLLDVANSYLYSQYTQLLSRKRQAWDV